MYAYCIIFLKATRDFFLCYFDLSYYSVHKNIKTQFIKTEDKDI